MVLLNPRVMLERLDQIKRAVWDSKYIIDTSGVNRSDYNGNVILHYAAFLGDREVVEWLLSQGANVKAAQIKGSTCLHIAADKGHTEVVKILLSAGADTEVINQDADNPLHLAAYRGHTKVVELLVNSGAQIEARAKDDHTALHLAAQNGHFEVVKFLLSNGIDANIEAANMLTPLHLAAESGRLEVVNSLLRNGADINIVIKDGYGYKALHLAARGGHFEVVQLLLSNGANIEPMDTNTPSPLYLAAGERSFEIVEFLLDKGANVNVTCQKNSMTPLHYAVCRFQPGCMKIVKFLLSRGVDVNAIDILGNTALDYAIQENKLQLTLLLSASGGRMNLQDSTLPKLKQNINHLIDIKNYCPISKAQGLLNILTNLMPSEQELAAEIKEKLLPKFAPIIYDAIPSIIKQSTHSIDNISTIDKDNLIKFQKLCLNLEAANIKSVLDTSSPGFWENLTQAFAQSQNLLNIPITRLEDSAPSAVDLMETDEGILTSNSLPLNKSSTSEHEVVGTTGDVEMVMEAAQLR